MADRSAEFVIGVSGDDTSIDAFLGNLKTKFRSATADIEKSTSQLQLFGQLQDNLPKIQQAIDRNTAAAAQFRAEIDRIKEGGGKVTDDLTKGLAASEKAAAAAHAEFAKQATQLSSLNSSLKTAGVDTTNLAAAEAKLAQQYKATSVAAAELAAKQTLGLKTLSDIKPQIDKITAAYETLRASGTLSVKELSQAQAAVTREIAALKAGVTGLATASKQTALDLKSSFLSAQATFLAVSAAVTAVALAVGKVVTATNDYKQGVAEIGIVSRLSKSELDNLGEGVRKLARDIGFDLNEGLKELQEIIRSGIAPENSLKVLEISAQAAKAGLTDLNTTTKISTILIDGFGAEVSDLPRLFDALRQGAHDGGATFKQFAENAGPLLNVARAAKVPFDSLVATLTVMTNASNDAAGSTAALTKIIVKLGDPDVRANLRAIGITTTDVLEIFKQLGEQNKGVQSVLDLGIAGTKAAAGVASLTNNANLLGPELERIRESAGTFGAALAAAADLPRAKWENLQAAIHDTEVSLGKPLLGNSEFIEWITAQINWLNDFIFETEDAKDNAREMARFVDQAGGAFTSTGEKTKAATAEIEKAKNSLGEFGPKLLAAAQAMQAAAATDIAQLQERVQREIDGLDRSTKAQAATSARIIQLRTEEADERLALIRKNEDNVSDLVNKALAAREAKASESEKNLQSFAAETAKIRIDALKPVLAQYVAHYNALIAQAQGFADKLKGIEQERLVFNDDVEKKRVAAFQTDLKSFSALDAYAAKIKQVDTLISKGREAAVDGDIANSKRYFTEAEQISNSLTTVVNKDHQEVIGKFELQTTKLRITKQVAEEYNNALDRQAGLAKKGFDAAKDGIADVLPKIKELEQRYDDLNSKVADGLNFRAITDEKSVADAEQVLNELARDRTVKFIPNLSAIPIEGQTGFVGPPTPSGFARGGPVGFASGGPVFRRPSWSKVPGSGSGDTVPALLERGSFVLRKAASMGIGDSLLGRLVQGFANGGVVGFARGGKISPMAEKWKKLHDQKTLAETEFGDILSRASGLPISKWGQDVRDYVGRVLEIIRASMDPTEIQTLLDRVLDYYEAFYPAIEDAKKHNVPLVMGMYSEAPAEKSADSQLFKDASKKLVDRNPGHLFFARGGLAGRDTVPAMLTPGEYVFRPEAVQAISRLFGGGFLPAMNALQIPSGFLDNFVAPRPHRAVMAHFAEGGPVGSVMSAGGGSGLSSGPGTVHATFNIQVDNPEEFLRKHLMPAWDKITKRAR